MATSAYHSALRSPPGFEAVFGSFAPTRTRETDTDCFATDEDPELYQLDASADTSALDWSEEDVVQLHWRLLLELRRLPDPDTPLEEKLDTLAWALTEPELDAKPFSFANCLRVVGTSPLSPTEYFGMVQVEEVRDWLRCNARRWIASTLARYPAWVQSLVREQPDWVSKQLSRNPQWLNEQMKAKDTSAQADLFGAPTLLLAS